MQYLEAIGMKKYFLKWLMHEESGAADLILVIEWIFLTYVERL